MKGMANEEKVSRSFPLRETINQLRRWFSARERKSARAQHGSAWVVEIGRNILTQILSERYLHSVKVNVRWILHVTILFKFLFGTLLMIISEYVSDS